MMAFGFVQEVPRESSIVQALWLAALIWIVTFVVQAAVGFGVAMVGILELAAIIGT